MPTSNDKKEKFQSLKPEVAPTSQEGISLVDLYVYLPSSNKYIKWVKKGQKLDQEHLEKIKTHVDPNFYTADQLNPDLEVDNDTELENFKFTEANAQEDKINEKTYTTSNKIDDDIKVFKSNGQQEKMDVARLVAVGGASNQSKSEMEIKVFTSEPKAELITNSKENYLDTFKLLFGTESAEKLAEPIDEELKDIYKDIEGAKPGDLSLQDSRLDVLSEKICNLVAPEVGDVRTHLKNIPAFVSIMDDSSAISTMAILFAIAQGQKTRGVFKDLSYACLLMDISLVGVPEVLKKKWISNPDSLSEDEKLTIETHPRKSHAVVMQKFKNLPEIVGQMILGHHELFNGRGFPRKLRSDHLPPVVRILSFAVDVHYHMKRAELMGEAAPSIEQVVTSFTNPKIEPHLRRHNLDLCRKFLKYMIEGDPN